MAPLGGSIFFFNFFRFQFNLCWKSGLKMFGNAMLHVMWALFMGGALNGAPLRLKIFCFFSTLNTVWAGVGTRKHQVSVLMDFGD